MKRRDFIKRAGIAGAGFALLPTGFRAIRLGAATAFNTPGLSDPVLQPMFSIPVPDALAPSFKFMSRGSKKRVKVAAGPAIQSTGLIDTTNGVAGPAVQTPVWGYGTPAGGFTWPGKTFEVQSGVPLQVKWENKLLDPATGLPLSHMLPVDQSLHWCYTQFSLATDGVPVVMHLHGGHTDFQFDGNPEFFFSPGWAVRGPQWRDKDYVYKNDQPAGNLWYHDHALGITRLNVYAGLAGFYFIRDGFDTGLQGNSASLPAWPYEKAYAIQDRMFTDKGLLFYPSMPGDPYWDDFINGAVAENGGDPNLVPQPSALAEFFGDHMVVNGVIWPYEDVERRNYRLHLLNGTDSRFMIIRFRLASGPNSEVATGGALPFSVIGSDQGLASSPNTVTELLFEPGSRYDIIFDFKQVAQGSRVIMENLGGDEPFGGTPGAQIFERTDRVMAFNVVLPLSPFADASPTGIAFGPNVGTPTRTRKVALFEGQDEYGRLQPLLGTAEPATDYANNAINWPATPAYQNAGLVGQMEGAIPWHSPTTENPALGSTEEWEIWNATGDAHPVHLHLVHFEVLGRKAIKWDSNTVPDERVLPDDASAAGDGTYLVTQPVVQHNSLLGSGFKIRNLTTEPGWLPTPDGYVENTPKDMVTALPDQVTYIKATFDKPGRYVWHCHILSHEDHEMMRVMHVTDPANPSKDQLAETVAPVLAPTKFALKQNYPNPFNPSTNIVFQLPNEKRVKLTIYDIRGREIKTLINNKTYGAGSHSVVWDGTNKFGRNVASGVYIYRIKAGSYSKSLKMNLIR